MKAKLTAKIKMTKYSLYLFNCGWMHYLTLKQCYQGPYQGIDRNSMHWTQPVIITHCIFPVHQLAIKWSEAEWLTELRFYVPLDTKQVILPSQSLGTVLKKLNLTQQRHAYKNKPKHKIIPPKLNLTDKL